MTSNEIAIRQPSTEVDSWSGVMPQVVKLSEYIAATEFVPQALRNRPAAVAAAILSGREMGIGPMRALAHVHMIEGRPALSAEQKRAAALAAGHEIVYVETTTTRCVVKGRRRGGGEWSTVTWSMDDAKKAGLSGRQNWSRHPRRMLQARATGELCDLLFPDATAGLATYEELLDDTDAAGIKTEGHAAPARATARRRTAVRSAPAKQESAEAASEPQSAPLPPLPGEEGYDDPAAKHMAAKAAQDEPALVTKPQMRKMHALFNQVEWTGRGDRLHATSAIIGRTVNSASDLTLDEAKTLIDTLERVADGPDPAARLGQLVNEAMAAETADGDVIEGELVEDGAGS